MTLTLIAVSRSLLFLDYEFAYFGNPGRTYACSVSDLGLRVARLKGLGFSCKVPVCRVLELRLLGFHNKRLGFSFREGLGLSGGLLFQPEEGFSRKAGCKVRSIRDGFLHEGQRRGVPVQRSRRSAALSLNMGS